MPCAPGRFQPSARKANCSICPAGYFANKPGAVVCQPCGLVSRSMDAFILQLPSPHILSFAFAFHRSSLPLHSSGLLQRSGWRFELCRVSGRQVPRRLRSQQLYRLSAWAIRAHTRRQCVQSLRGESSRSGSRFAIVARDISLSKIAFVALSNKSC